MADEFRTLSLFGDEPIEQWSAAQHTEALSVGDLPDAYRSTVHDELLNTDGLLDITINDEVEGQLGFIDFDEWWKVEWQGMPEFVQCDVGPWKSMYVHFRSREDMLEFGKVMDQRLTVDTPSIWFPQHVKEVVINKAYVDES